MARKKISLIGAGNIGGVMALLIAQKELGDVVIYDVVEGLPQGKALDIMESSPVNNSDVSVKGTNNYADIQGSDVVIVTAGLPRKPGMSRDDLLNTNVAIIKTVAENIKKYAANAYVIVVSNPLDAMVYAMHKLTGFPKNRVMGMAGLLDSSRMRYFIAAELGVSASEVTTLVLGGHGDTMIPLTRYCSVGGVPVTKLIKPEILAKIVERTKNAGTEIVGLLKTGSAFFSPAATSVEMAEAILKDKKRVIVSACLLEGEYGIKGYFIGVPAVIGANGVEKVIEVDLNDEEKKLMATSFQHVKSLVDAVKL